LKGRKYFSDILIFLLTQQQALLYCARMDRKKNPRNRANGSGGFIFAETAKTLFSRGFHYTASAEKTEGRHDLPQLQNQMPEVREGSQRQSAFPLLPVL